MNYSISKTKIKAHFVENNIKEEKSKINKLYPDIYENFFKCRN